MYIWSRRSIATAAWRSTCSSDRDLRYESGTLGDRLLLGELELWSGARSRRRGARADRDRTPAAQGVARPERELLPLCHVEVAERARARVSARSSRARRGAARLAGQRDAAADPLRDSRRNRKVRSDSCITDRRHELIALSEVGDVREVAARRSSRSSVEKNFGRARIELRRADTGKARSATPTSTPKPPRCSSIAAPAAAGSRAPELPRSRERIARWATSARSLLELGRAPRRRAFELGAALGPRRARRGGPAARARRRARGGARRAEREPHSARTSSEALWESWRSRLGDCPPRARTAARASDPAPNPGRSACTRSLHGAPTPANAGPSIARARTSRWPSTSCAPATPKEARICSSAAARNAERGARGALAPERRGPHPRRGRPIDHDPHARAFGARTRRSASAPTRAHSQCSRDCSRSCSRACVRCRKPHAETSARACAAGRSKCSNRRACAADGRQRAASSLLARARRARASSTCSAIRWCARAARCSAGSRRCSRRCRRPITAYCATTANRSRSSATRDAARALGDAARAFGVARPARLRFTRQQERRPARLRGNARRSC